MYFKSIEQYTLNLTKNFNPDVILKIHTCAGKMQDIFAGSVMLCEVREVPGV